MSLTPGEIRQVLDILANSQWDEAMVTIGDVTIAVARNGAALPTAAPASRAIMTSEVDSKPRSRNSRAAASRMSWRFAGLSRSGLVMTGN